MSTAGPGRRLGHTSPMDMAAPASMRVSVSTAVGVVAGVLTGLSMGWMFAGSIGFDVAALTFVIWTWAAVRGMDAAQTATHATREDPTRRLTRLIVLAACVASLGGVGFLLVRAAAEQGAQRAGVAALGVGSIAVSWFVVHGLFTLHYAELYYSGGGDREHVLPGNREYVAGDRIPRNGGAGSGSGGSGGAGEGDGQDDFVFKQRVDATPAWNAEHVERRTIGKGRRRRKRELR